MRPNTNAILTAACTVVALAGPLALADDDAQWQFGGRQQSNLDQMGMRVPDPPIKAAQMDHYAKVLGMDEAQLMMAQELHTGFRDQYMREWLTYAESASDAQSLAMMTQDWQAMQTEASERRATFQKSVDERTESLLSDIRLLLTQEQEANWSRLERDRRRERYLPSMSDNGVRAMDLVAMADLLGLDDAERASLNTMLEVYASELDGALVSYISKADALDDKIDRYEKRQGEMMKLYEGDQPDMEKIMEVQQDFAELGSQLSTLTLALHKESQRVLDVNRRHTAALAREIPSHAKSEFERMTTRPAQNANPWMSGEFSRYKRSVTFLENIEQMRTAYEAQFRAMDNGSGAFEGIFQMMRAVEPLSEDQKREVELITADYESEMDAIRKEAARKAGRAADEDEQRMITVPTPRGNVTLYKMGENGWGGAWMGGGDGEQDEETQKRKAEIDQESIDRLRAILTFYQRAAIAQN